MNISVTTDREALFRGRVYRVTGEPVGAAAWHDLPTTYLVCADDKGTPARLQREFARRAGKVVELDAGHHPFLSQPAAVRDLLLSL